MDSLFYFTGWLIVFSFFHPFFLYFFTRPFWRVYKSLPLGGAFRFHLLDLVVGSFALAPSLYCVAEAIKTMEQPNPSGGVELLIIGIHLLCSQACGFVIGRAHNVVPSEEEQPGLWVQSGWVLLCMLFGLVLVPLSAILLGLSLALLGFFLSLSPLLAPIAIFLYALNKWQKR